MQFVTEQLSKASNSITDFSAAVSRVLKKYSEEIVGREFKCPNCGGTEVDNSSGCNVCKSCGWSRCE
jgi:predicted Zn-ribbon and HTH transcriptional regulator